MYFSSILLLLLVSKFAQLQPVPQQTESILIPFNYPDTSVMETIRNRILSEFGINDTALLKLYLLTVVLSIRDVLTCEFKIIYIISRIIFTLSKSIEIIFVIGKKILDTLKIRKQIVTINILL